MELRGHKQATAHSHEHTKNSNRSKKKKFRDEDAHSSCGEVEDVVGALTPVVGGVAQVLHDLLVELQLLLVAEVDEKEEEKGQEER